MEKEQFFQQMVLQVNWLSTYKRMKLGLSSYHKQNYFQWAIDLKDRAQKALRENIQEQIFVSWVRQSLFIYITKSTNGKRQIYKLDFIQIQKSFAKDTIKKRQDQPHNGKTKPVLVCGLSETHFDYSNDSFLTLQSFQSPQASLLHKRRLLQKGKEMLLFRNKTKEKA